MVASNSLAPDLEHLDADLQRRVRLTLSCRDTDHLPKVVDAGQVRLVDGQPVQVMHNGLVVGLGCYYGPWMDAIIEGLRGHHEPQEEVAFAAILQRLHDTGDHGPMIEFGSFWAYYSMWFTRALPSSRTFAMEPDPAYLAVGVRNARLNDLQDRILFLPGAIGPAPGRPMDFRAESDGATYQVPAHDLASFMAAVGIERAALVLADIQGAETVLLQRASGILADRVRFLLVSTHHHLISGSAVTHQQALQVLTEAGAHIIAEHSVSESFSGDGLIAASFDPRDTDLVVPISHARASESLFGGLEVELQAAVESAAVAKRREAQLAKRVQRAEALVARQQRELEAIRRSRVWRLARRLRSLRRRTEGRLRAARRK